jgi:hypothetical protein
MVCGWRGTLRKTSLSSNTTILLETGNVSLFLFILSVLSFSFYLFRFIFFVLSFSFYLFRSICFRSIFFRSIFFVVLSFSLFYLFRCSIFFVGLSFSLFYLFRWSIFFVLAYLLYSLIILDLASQGQNMLTWQWALNQLVGEGGEWICDGNIPHPVVMFLQMMR